jgi:arylsulfatase A
MKKNRNSVRKPGRLMPSVIACALIGWIVLSDGVDLKADPDTPSERNHTNILLMMADDLGYEDLGCYGSSENQTPVLDRLAEEGMRFTDFYAGSAVCSPSRAAFLTGRFSVRAGVYSWIHTSHRMHLRREQVTIAERLNSKGYSTAHVGKWHLGYDLVDGSGSGPDPGDHGFDHWLATGNNARPSHHNPNNFVRNGRALGEVEGYSCQIVADEAIHWLETNRDKSRPFYLNVWFHEPHRRVAAPEKFTQKHQDTREPAYYGCIENMDSAIGRLLDKLEVMGAADETLVVFTSDNGSYMAGSNGPLKGRKTQLWEGGIREPAIMRWPGRIQPGTVCKEPAGVVDLLPTVCAAAGVTVPQDRTIDGADLTPLFNGGSLERQTPLYWFYHPSRPVCVIRQGDWSLAADPKLDLPRGNMFKEESIGDIKKTGLENFRLYNLRQDPGQKTDLGGREPERLRRMKRMMTELHADVMKEAYDWRP